MIGLPEENLVQIWRQMGENKDWNSFMKTVMGQCGRTKNLDVLMVDYLVREAYDLKKSNQNFPDTPGGLVRVLEERMNKSYVRYQ
jgi:hypothetical protein